MSEHKLIVIKLGGAVLDKALADPDFFMPLANLKTPFVLVHGGGPEINQLLKALDIESRFIDGQRVTDAATLAVVEMVLRGKVNPILVRRLMRAGLMAQGLSGVDQGLLLCTPENPALGFVGRVERVKTRVLDSWLRQLIVPVIAPIGLFPDGSACNINADLAAAAIASQLGANRVIFLTDQLGILDENRKLIPKLTHGELLDLESRGILRGGMVVKARAIREMIELDHSLEVLVADGIGGLSLKLALQGTEVGTRCVWENS